MRPSWRASPFSRIIPNGGVFHRAITAYGKISIAFGMATIGQSAGRAAAKRLDAACAAAD